MTDAVAALVQERGGSVALSDVVMREPGPGEVLVRIAASGVCPTDLFGMAGSAGDRFPAVFGHEGAGVVEQTGAGVTGLNVGDRVVLGFDSCGACPSGAAGHPAYCERFAELNYAAHADAVWSGGRATTGWMAQSSWSTHVVTRASNAVPIGPDVPWDVAATLGCGVLTGAGAILNVLRPGPDDTLVVLGAGTTGLAAVMAARHRGVARIIVSEPAAARRELALCLGATSAVPPEELVATGVQARFVLDTVGSQAAVDAALAIAAPHGVCATVALRAGSNRVSISQSRLLWGRSLTGVIEGDADIARDVPLLAALWRNGRLPVERLIAPFPFERIADAVEAMRTGAVVKPVVRMQPVTPSPAPAPATGPPDLLTRLLAGGVAEADLPHLWRSLPAVAPSELRGLWRGHGLSATHPAHRLLSASNWFGKLFTGDDDVTPIVARRPDGTLAADTRFARGGATLRTALHDGIPTAAMIYDRLPIVDLFTRIGPGAVLGVMTGRDAADGNGRLYHFVLEKVADQRVLPAASTPEQSVTIAAARRTP